MGLRESAIFSYTQRVKRLTEGTPNDSRPERTPENTRASVRLRFVRVTWSGIVNAPKRTHFWKTNQTLRKDRSYFCKAAAYCQYGASMRLVRAEQEVMSIPLFHINSNIIIPKQICFTLETSIFVT